MWARGRRCEIALVRRGRARRDGEHRARAGASVTRHQGRVVVMTASSERGLARASRAPARRLRADGGGDSDCARSRSEDDAGGDRSNVREARGRNSGGSEPGSARARSAVSSSAPSRSVTHAVNDAARPAWPRASVGSAKGRGGLVRVELPISRVCGLRSRATAAASHASRVPSETARLGALERSTS